MDAPPVNKSMYYDYVVIGCGGVGSSTLYRLAKESHGESVLGIEQYELGHHNGGSQDVSRAIRYAYHDPYYIALASGAYEAWGEVEEESGLQILHTCGTIVLAEKNSPGERTLRDWDRAMDEAGIKYETLDGLEIHRKFPSFTPKSNLTGQYQKDGGLVDAALANAIHIQLARKYGAETVEHTTARKISRESDGTLRISTSNGNFRCKKVIITAGAWINDVTRSVGVNVPLTVTQEQVTYFGTPHMKEFSYKRFPCFAYCGDDKLFYTLPIYGNSGFKIGIDAGGPEVTANTRTFVPDPKIVEECRALLNDVLPRSLGPILFTKTCLYAMTADREFVIDTAHRTGYPDVVICCGAGHIFKFAALVGKILTSLARDRRVDFDISRFTLDRPAITDPHFKKSLSFLDSDASDVKAKL